MDAPQKHLGFCREPLLVRDTADGACVGHTLVLAVRDILLAQLQSEVCTAPVRPAHSGPCMCLMMFVCVDLN